jgi:hypothetical protein
MDHDPNDRPDPNDELDENDEEPIGYGNPPKHTRWAKGFCPNWAGRPPNARGRKPILARIANEEVILKTAGNQQKVRRADVVLMAVRNATANGDPKAQLLYDKLLNEVRDEEPPGPKGVLFTGERLTSEEWEAEFGHIGGGPPPLPKAIRMEHVRHLLQQTRSL